MSRKRTHDENDGKRRRRALGRVDRAQAQLDRSKGVAGVPRVVDRQIGRRDRSEQTQDAVEIRAWLLDMLAWAGHGQCAPRLSSNPLSPRMPAVVLPEVEGPEGGRRLVALDLGDALRKLKSRSRSFSQIAGRFSPLVLAAREGELSLWIELWDLDEEGHLNPPDPWLTETASKLASYLEATVTLGTAAQLSERAARLGEVPHELRRRNPMAAALGWARQVERGDGDQ